MYRHGGGSHQGTLTRIQRTSAVHAAMAELAKVCGKGRLLEELATIGIFCYNLLVSSYQLRGTFPITRYITRHITNRMPRRGGRRGERRGGQGGGPRTEAAIQIEAKVLDFVDITQAPPDVAKHYIDAYGGNMEAAVTGFLEGGRNEVQLRESKPSGEEREGEEESRGAVGRAVDVVDLDDKDRDYNEEEDRDEGLSDDSLDQLQTLASHRSRRTRSNRGGGRNRKGDDLDDDEEEEDDEAYMSEDLYGEEEERFKCGRRTRRGHRRSMRQMSKQPMEHQLSREDEDEDEDEKDAAQHIPAAVLSLPDVNLEEQKMLMAAMTGQAYTGKIPDFSIHQSYVSKPLSPGAIERQILREEQDLAFQESLAKDRERQQREEQALIEQLEREESERRKERILSEELEEKKRQLPAEPALDDPMGLLLAIRLPGGTRLKRRFSKTDPLMSVFDYVDVECGPGLANTTYRLVTNFPRKVFERAAQQQASMGLGDLGFSMQEALFVETTAP